MLMSVKIRHYRAIIIIITRYLQIAKSAASVLTCFDFMHNCKSVYLKVGSHDPIFSSNYSLAHFLRQQLNV